MHLVRFTLRVGAGQSKLREDKMLPLYFILYHSVNLYIKKKKWGGGGGVKPVLGEMLVPFVYRLLCKA